jgi:hypothetical protein
MGSLRGGDGDGRPPPDNGGLPDLPPEWGTVVVPDDLAELDREAAELRRERRRKTRRARWRHRFGLAPRADDMSDTPPVGIPLLIMSIAIIAALTSLFAITLTTRTPRTTPQQTTTAPAAIPTAQMIDLTLTDAAGKPLHLRESLPSVILLLDGCSCGELIADTVVAAPAKVTVLAVDRTAPFIPPGVHATALADPEQALLATYSDGPDRAATPAGVPTAVFVAADGTVVATVSPALTIANLRQSFGLLGH